MEQVKVFLLFFPSGDKKVGVHILDFVTAKVRGKGKDLPKGLFQEGKCS